MIKFDLRLRIAAAIALACIAIVGALGVTLYIASEEMEEALVEQIVSEELDFLVQRHRSNPGYVPAPGPNLQYHIVRTPADAANLPAVLRALGPGRHELDLGHGLGERHVAVQQSGDTRFLVVYDVGPHERREQQFKNLLLFALAAVALISLGAGYLLAVALTRQLTDLANRVSVRATNESHALLERSGQDREVAALARALDRYHSRMLGMIRREQEFTANASHELRTPLTAIQTSCELLALEPGLSDKARERIDYVAAGTQRMAGQLDTLLFLAREPEPANVESVALRACVQDAADPFRGELARKGVAFDVAVAPEDRVDADRRALHIVLANLIRNASRHTEHGFVRVTYAGRKITVADSGTGIGPEALPRIFERYYRGGDSPDGLGLGLAIVKRICEHAGWSIVVESAPDEGSAFSITFP